MPVTGSIPERSLIAPAFCSSSSVRLSFAGSFGMPMLAPSGSAENCLYFFE